MKRSTIGAALALGAACILSGRAAAADCADQSCPREVSTAMAASATRLPLVLSVGLRTLTYSPSARDRFDGGVQSSSSGYEFMGDALGNSPLRAYGPEIGIDWAFSPFAYIGADASWGTGSWWSQPFAAGQTMVGPRGTVNEQMWLSGLRAGVRLPLGPVSLRTELLGGAEWVSLEQYATAAGGQALANAQSVFWLVEPRVAADLWVSPFVALSAFATMPGFQPQATNAGVAVAWHPRSFDGRYIGVL
jgi:hypothetical protein